MRYCCRCCCRWYVQPAPLSTPRQVSTAAAAVYAVGGGVVAVPARSRPSDYISKTKNVLISIAPFVYALLRVLPFVFALYCCRCYYCRYCLRSVFLSTTVSTAAADVAVYAGVVGVVDIPARSRPFALNPRRKKDMSLKIFVCPLQPICFFHFFFMIRAHTETRCYFQSPFFPLQNRICDLHFSFITQALPPHRV